jgi:hypothetical protein
MIDASRVRLPKVRATAGVKVLVSQDDKYRKMSR